MDELGSEGASWQIDSKRLASFRKFAASKPAIMDSDTQKEMLAAFGSDATVRSDMYAWMILERHMPLKEIIPSIKQGCDPSVFGRLAKAAVKQRHLHNPPMHRLSRALRHN